MLPCCVLRMVPGLESTRAAASTGALDGLKASSLSYRLRLHLFFEPGNMIAKVKADAATCSGLAVGLASLDCPHKAVRRQRNRSSCTNVTCRERLDRRGHCWRCQRRRISLYAKVRKQVLAASTNVSTFDVVRARG